MKVQELYKKLRQLNRPNAVMYLSVHCEIFPLADILAIDSAVMLVGEADEDAPLGDDKVEDEIDYEGPFR